MSDAGLAYGTDRMDIIEQIGSSASWFFEGGIDERTAKRALDKVKALEDMLTLADQFGEYAAKFCALEADVYLRIAKVEGAESRLTKARRDLVRWLRGLDEADVARVMDECREGTRIDVIRRREMPSATRAERCASECASISDRIVSEATETGQTKLSASRFYQETSCPSVLDRRTVSAYVERTRDKLLEKGVMGLGDGEGTYIAPSKCERTEVAKIVSNRLRSIEADIRSLSDICARTGYVVSSGGVRTIVSAVRMLGHPRCEVMAR